MLDSSGFNESFDRTDSHFATWRDDDKRVERESRQLVRWTTQRFVPDVGGMGWRSKSGHLLKNQAYYPQVSKNLWDCPTYAGVNTWKEYHGPRLRTNAKQMEQFDQYDSDCDEWEARKTFVNNARSQTLDRFYNRKNQRSLMETSSSWAPNRQSRRQVHSVFETFDQKYDDNPPKELKKVFTPKVLQNDRQAIRQISARINGEENCNEAFNRMDFERRAELKSDFLLRQARTDRLMQLSGQPVPFRPQPGSASTTSLRTEGLASPKTIAKLRDVTSLIDFRGLIHADNADALETLFPGTGRELSVQFRAHATVAAGPGSPRRAETPPVGQKAQGDSAYNSKSKWGLSPPRWSTSCPVGVPGDHPRSLRSCKSDSALGSSASVFSSSAARRTAPLGALPKGKTACDVMSAYADLGTPGD